MSIWDVWLLIFYVLEVYLSLIWAAMLENLSYFTFLKCIAFLFGLQVQNTVCNPMVMAAVLSKTTVARSRLNTLGYPCPKNIFNEREAFTSSIQAFQVRILLQKTLTEYSEWFFNGWWVVREQPKWKSLVIWIKQLWDELLNNIKRLPLRVIGEVVGWNPELKKEAVCWRYFRFG